MLLKKKKTKKLTKISFKWLNEEEQNVCGTFQWPFRREVIGKKMRAGFRGMRVLVGLKLTKGSTGLLLFEREVKILFFKCKSCLTLIV